MQVNSIALSSLPRINKQPDKTSTPVPSQKSTDTFSKSPSFGQIKAVWIPNDTYRSKEEEIMVKTLLKHAQTSYDNIPENLELRAEIRTEGHWMQRFNEYDIAVYAKFKDLEKAREAILAKHPDENTQRIKDIIDRDPEVMKILGWEHSVAGSNSAIRKWRKEAIALMDKRVADCIKHAQSVIPEKPDPWDF